MLYVIVVYVNDLSLSWKFFIW